MRRRRAVEATAGPVGGPNGTMAQDVYPGVPERRMETSKERDRWFMRWLKWTFWPPHAIRTVEIWRRVDTRSVTGADGRAVRVRRTVASVLRRPRQTGPVWAITMVKNEADIIGESISNLFTQGIDHVLIADNGSTDETMQVLRELSLRLPVHVIQDPIVPYWQGEKMSHLARVATRMGASWVVPFDADELWKGSGSQTVAQVLRSCEADYVIASWWDFMPLAEGDGTTYAQRHLYRERASRPQVKVAFRAHWLARIWIGNHHVTVPRHTTQTERLRVAHYQFRTPEQMIRKAKDGAIASRLAGHREDQLAQWFEMEGATAAEAAEKVRLLAASASLVYDPADLW